MKVGILTSFWRCLKGFAGIDQRNKISAHGTICWGKPNKSNWHIWVKSIEKHFLKLSETFPPFFVSLLAVLILFKCGYAELHSWNTDAISCSICNKWKTV